MTDDVGEEIKGADDPWLSKGVGGIGAASFLADANHEIPTALLPSLLTSTLGASAAALGVIEGVSDGLAGLARLGGGALADDPHRRRNVAVGGYTSTAVLASATGLATTPLQVGVLRAGAWTARGVRVPARNALLADLTSPSAYGRAYGFERTMDNLGAVVGPLLALILVNLVGTRTAIGLSVIPGLLAAGAIIYAVRHAPHLERHDREPIRIKLRPVLRGKLGRLMMAVSAFEMGNVAATLLILRATELLEPGRGAQRATTVALVLYLAYNLAATLISLPAGHLGDRRGQPKVLLAGVALFGVAYLGFAAGAGSALVLAPWFVMAGIAIGLVETAEHASVASLSPADLLGSSFGLLAAVQSFGNLAASAIAGVIWTVASPAWAFLYLVGWMFVAAVGLIAGSSAAASVARTTGDP